MKGPLDTDPWLDGWDFPDADLWAQYDDDDRRGEEEDEDA